jgi:hypothetical protein
MFAGSRIVVVVGTSSSSAAPETVVVVGVIAKAVLVGGLNVVEVVSSPPCGPLMQPEAKTTIANKQTAIILMTYTIRQTRLKMPDL